MTMFSATENAVVREARSVPDLVGKLQQVDSPLATQIAGKAIVASRTPWGTVLVPAVAWLATRYGLGWSPDLDASIAGVLVLVCSFCMRAITRTPITGWLHPAPVLAVTAASPIAPINLTGRSE